MSEAKHTPGPWSLEDVTSQGTSVYKKVKAGRDSVGSIGCYKLGKERLAEQEANALLIAAAPELLASVIELLGPLEAASAELARQGKFLDANGEDAFDRARAAIAKATGGQP